ncbi:MAG: hypothetical protein WD023_03975 [Ilumatobacteraceae bacterium]
MSTLPQPPAPATAAVVVPMRDPRPGELAPAWRVVFVVGWVGTMLGFASVWKSSRTMGLSTWWLGPSAEPRSIAVQLVPFVIPVLLVVAASRNARFLPYWGVLGSLALGAIAAGDLGRFQRLALVELAVAGAALAVSLASFAGVLRGRSEPEN